MNSFYNKEKKLHHTLTMSYDIILSKLPFQDGAKTVIYRTETPNQVTWEDLFSFIEEKTKVPRKFISANDAWGRRIDGGKKDKYPGFKFDNYLMYSKYGVATNSAFITVSLKP